MTEQILYIKSLPRKSTSTRGKWIIPVRKTITYSNGVKRDYDDVIRTYTKKSAMNIIEIYRHNKKSIV